MQSAKGCIQLEKIAKDAEGARRGITRRSSTEGSMFGDARMQLLKPEEQACMQVTRVPSTPCRAQEPIQKHHKLLTFNEHSSLPGRSDS